MKTAAQALVTAWGWLNHLSLDVCAGALAGGIMASVLLGADPGWAYWVVLPLAIWLIYTADHLIDGIRAGLKASQSRRRFHRDHARSLMVVMGLVTVVTAFLAFSYLNKHVIIYGLILGAMALAYLIIVLFIGKGAAGFLPKEILVAFFYTAGIWGPVIILGQFSGTAVMILIGLFFLLAFEDLVFLSYMESGADSKEGQSSLAIVLGEGRTKQLLLFLGSCGMLAALLVMLKEPAIIVFNAAMMLFLMQTCLLAIIYLSKYLLKYDLYRFLSEAVFFLPALMLI